MDSHIMRFIWRYSRGQQLTVLLLTCLSFPLLYLSLELPKRIVNDAISDATVTHTLFGTEVGAVTYLMILSVSLLALVLINGAFKMRINTYKGIIGERLVRRLRYMLIDRTLRFPLKQFTHVSQGEMIATVVAETEPLAEFSGESIALPLFQGGTLLTILIFMFVQNWALGLASIALIPIQLYLIPKLQRQVNSLKKQRVKRVRVLSQRLGESVSGAREIRIQGTQRYTLAEFSYRLGELFRIRLEIFKKKFFMKFLNNTIGQMTPFLFYSIGGYMVLQGELSLGALVAALAAYKDILGPWKELLNHYQRYQDAVVKYEQIIEQFQPAGLLTFQAETAGGDHTVESTKTHLALQNITAKDEQGATLFAPVNLQLAPGECVAVSVAQPMLRNQFADIIAGLETPASGRVLINDRAIEHYPQHWLRGRLAYVGPDPFLFNAAISYNMGYGLNYIPPDLQTLTPTQREQLHEAVAAGNSGDWFDESFLTVWTDFSRLGVDSWDDMHSMVSDILELLDASDTVFELALLEKYEPDVLQAQGFDTVLSRLEQARLEVAEQLQQRALHDLVQTFDPDAFNASASLAENILFGAITDAAFDTRQLAEMPLLTEALKQEAVFERVMEVAQETVRFLVNIYADLNPNDRLIQLFELHEEARYEQLSELLKATSESSLEAWDRPTQVALLEVFLTIVPDDLNGFSFCDVLCPKLVAVRQKVTQQMPDALREHYHPYQQDSYNPGLNIIDNLLFGRVSRRQEDAWEQLWPLIRSALRVQRLDEALVALFFIHSEAGIGGSRVHDGAKEGISLMRVLLKRPDVLIMHDALQTSSRDEQQLIVKRLKEYMPQMSIVWINSSLPDHEYFERYFNLDEAGLHHAGQTEHQTVQMVSEAVQQHPNLSAIKRLKLFESLTASQIELIALRSTLIHPQAGEHVLRASQSPNHVFALLEGEASLYMDEEGARYRVFHLQQYQLFGELAVLANQPYGMDFVADTDCKMLRIEADVLTSLVENNHQVAVMVLNQVAKKVIRSLHENETVE